jgi:hypothetical protein
VRGEAGVANGVASVKTTFGCGWTFLQLYSLELRVTDKYYTYLFIEMGKDPAYTESGVSIAHNTYTESRMLEAHAWLGTQLKDSQRLFIPYTYIRHVCMYILPPSYLDLLLYVQ